MSFKQKTCDHLEQISEVKIVNTYECEECVEMDSTWLHLRTCQNCGVTLCCDSSPNTHARKHARRQDHHIISSAEPGERWLYCYEHDTMKAF